MDDLDKCPLDNTLALVAALAAAAAHDPVVYPVRRPRRLTVWRL